MTDALKPCPFCGSDDAEALDMEGKHYVVCYDCALEGPFHKSRAAVIAAWNTRAALAAPAVPPGWQPIETAPAPLGPVERVVRPGAEARWYCLSREGMATLCADEEDAKEVAAESWVAWPQNGPYRVAKMVDADTAESLRTALTELRDRIKGHPAYASLTEDEECDVGGDTAELSYLARVADEALGPNV